MGPRPYRAYRAPDAEPMTSAELLEALRFLGGQPHVLDHFAAPLVEFVPMPTFNPTLMPSKICRIPALEAMPPAALDRLVALLRAQKLRRWALGDIAPAMVEVAARSPRHLIEPQSASWAAWVNHYHKTGRTLLVAKCEASGGFRELTTWPPRHQNFPDGPAGGVA